MEISKDFACCTFFPHACSSFFLFFHIYKIFVIVFLIFFVIFHFFFIFHVFHFFSLFSRPSKRGQATLSQNGHGVLLLWLLLVVVLVRR